MHDTLFFTHRNRALLTKVGCKVMKKFLHPVEFLCSLVKKNLPKPVFNLLPLHLRSDFREKSKQCSNWEMLGGQFLKREKMGNQFCMRKKIGTSVS